MVQKIEVAVYLSNNRNLLDSRQVSQKKKRQKESKFLTSETFIEKWKGHNIPLNIGFIDYAKAFDSVDQEHLWTVMPEMGFPAHILNMVSNLAWNGVGQGCGLASNIYTVYKYTMRIALKDFQWEYSVSAVQQFGVCR